MTAIYNITFHPVPGSTGSLIEYREASAATWITPNGAPNPTTLNQYPLALEQGKTYHVAVSAVEANCTKRRAIITVMVPAGPVVPCCPAGYTLAPDESYCFLEETTPATVSTSGICLAFSKVSGAYTQSGAKLYSSPIDLHLSAAVPHIVLTDPYWKGTPDGYGDESQPQAMPNESVMNRDSVWVDSDCNGVKDGLAACSVLQFTCLITLAEPQRMFVGIGGDNTFRMDLNSETIVQCEAGNVGIPSGQGGLCATAPPANGFSATNVNFNYWHIIPVDLLAGPNYISFQAVGDGSVNDAFAATIYDNTSEQIIAAQSDQDLNIVFRTGDFKGSTVDIATCPPGWLLDTTGGSGNYVCRRVLTSPTIVC